MRSHLREEPIVIETIFREYDIRGIVGDELHIAQVYDFACALAAYIAQREPLVTSVFVGMDGRTHSPHIKQALCQGLLDSGYSVISIGMCTSPILYYALSTASTLCAGVMITASHNTKEYNGFKICIGHASVWGLELQKVRSLFAKGVRLSAPLKGTLISIDVVSAYIEYLCESFSFLKGSDISMVIDCANGAAGTVIPTLIERMEWKSVTLLYPDVDGTYPNHEADPVVEKNMQDVKHAMLVSGAQVGIGFDGDADRMGAVTERGFLVPGDQLLALFARDVLDNNPGAAVVCDIKCSSGLLEVLQQWGAVACMSPCGHAIIKNRMAQEHALVAGELSCHFFFKDTYFGYDDGVYAMMRLLTILHTKQQTLGTLLQFFPVKCSTPEYRVTCDVTVRAHLIQDICAHFARIPNVDITTIDGVRVTFPYGWGLVRLSNTQPVVSMRFEGTEADDLARVKQDFIEALQPHFSLNLSSIFAD